MVALINGLFNTAFPLDSPVFFPNKENVSKNLRRIVSDMMILIAGELFHLHAADRLALVPAVERTMARLLDAVQELRGAGILTEEDEEIRVVRKFQFPNNNRLKIAKCSAFCRTSSTTNQVVEEAYYIG